MEVEDWLLTLSSDLTPLLICPHLNTQGAQAAQKAACDSALDSISEVMGCVNYLSQLVKDEEEVTL